MANNRGFTPEWLDELKRKNDIVSVVSKYVQLEQRGSKFWGCCPFHHEKTPSFCVDQYEGLFHCFGCKEGGDLISFVQKIESCDFHEAITRLAENAKMPLPEIVADEGIIKRKKEKDTILKVLDAAYKHYHENLYKPQAKPAQDYIKTRGFTRHELDDFAIGYSFDWNEMITYLLSQGFTKEQILLSGVAQTKDGNRIYDAMAERLVFPIFNSFGECVAFSARTLQKNDFAKYKNTAETPVFQKGRTVFGIHLLKRLKQEKGIENIVIVEGQIDVISMHRGGFKNTVAGLGTAFTADHARELKKLCNNIILCFDGDEAGEKATLRTIDILRNADMNVRIAVMPPKQDPDEILKSENGKEKMSQILANAKPIMDYYIDSFLTKNDMNTPNGKANFVKSVLEKLKTFSQPEQEAYLPRLRDLTNMPIDMLRRNLGINIMPTFEKKEEKVLPTRINGNKRAENFILASILHKKPFVDKRIDFNKLLDGREKQLEIIGSVAKVSSLFDIVDVENEPFWQDIVYFDFAEVKGNDEIYFNECVWSLAEEKLKQQKDEIMASYKTSHDLNERRALLMSAQQVDKKIREKNLEDFYG